MAEEYTGYGDDITAGRGPATTAQENQERRRRHGVDGRRRMEGANACGDESQAALWEGRAPTSWRSERVRRRTRTGTSASPDVTCEAGHARMRPRSVLGSTNRDNRVEKKHKPKKNQPTNRRKASR
jgi:hypothetical protein